MVATFKTLTIFKDMQDFTDSQFDRRAAGNGIAIKIDMLHSDVVEMKEAIKTLATAINRLAIVEERLSSTGQSLERAFVALEKVEARLEKVEHRVAQLEKVDGFNHQTNKWVEKAMWAAAAAAVLFVAKKAGLM